MDLPNHDEMRQRLIFALDVDNAGQAEEWVRILRHEVGIFKVGLELFVAEGPAILPQLRKAGAKSIFLDLKLHDIPATMRAAAKAGAGLGADFITCHCDQADIFTNMDLGSARLLGITLLTSIGAEDLAALGYEPSLCNPLNLVERRAKLALAAGCHGVVCSGQEAAVVRRVLGPEALIICPGIRLADGSLDDQKRIITPALAMAQGASHIVVGRPIRLAPDPAVAARFILTDMAKGAGNCILR